MMVPARPENTQAQIQTGVFQSDAPNPKMELQIAPSCSKFSHLGLLAIEGAIVDYAFLQQAANRPPADPIKSWVARRCPTAAAGSIVRSKAAQHLDILRLLNYRKPDALQFPIYIFGKSQKGTLPCFL
jgi:hypothetical protein